MRASSERQGIGGITFKGPTASKHALVKALAVGSHHVEILDARGSVLVDASVDVPNKEWRGVLTTVSSRRYAVVRAKQERPLRADKIVPLVTGSDPHVFIVPPGNRPIGKLDLDAFDDALVALDAPSVWQGPRGRTMRICSLDTQGRPTCL